MGARAPALSLAQDLCSFFNTTRLPWEECVKGGSHPRGESRPHPARLIPQAWGDSVPLTHTGARPVCVLPALASVFPSGTRYVPPR